MQFYASYRVPNIKSGQILYDVIMKRIKAEMQIGIKLFLEAMLAKIRVRTGFLRGSFGKVAKRFEVEDVVVGNNIKPEFYKGILKTPTSGQFLTSGKIRARPASITFEIQTEIEYMAVNDFQRANAWFATDAGTAAFTEYMQGVAGRIPDLSNILSYSVIRLRGNTISINEG